MDEIKMREDFEAAYEAEVRQLKEIHGDDNFDGSVFARDQDGNYVVGLVQAAWWGWKVSRHAALKEVKQMIDADWEDAADWLSLQLDG